MKTSSGMYSHLKRVEIRRPGRIALAALGIAIILIVAKSCGWFPAGERTRGAVGDGLREAPHAVLRVGIYPGAEFVPGLIENGGLETTRESAYQSRHKLKVKFILIEDAARSLKMLASGKLDIAWGTPDALAVNYIELSGANPVAFLHCGWSQGREMIIAGSRTASPSGLRGKTIACTENSPSHFFALYALKIAGLNARDLRWRYTMTPEDAARLFARKRADICVTSFQAGSAAMKKRNDSTVLLSTKEAPRLIATIFVVRESLLVSRGDIIRRFAEGWMEGADAAGSDPGSARLWMSRTFGYNSSEAGPEFEIAAISDYAMNRSFFELGGENAVGFSYLFDTAFALRYGEEPGEGPVPAGLAKNGDTISFLSGKISPPAKPGKAGIALLSPSGGWRIHSQVFTIGFGNNSAVPDLDSLARLRIIAGAAAVYRPCSLLIRALEDPSEGGWQNLPQRRIQEIISLASRDYGISRDRFHEIRNAPLPSQKASTKGRVEIVIASPHPAE